MNVVVKTILSRRSVREGFKPKSVPEEVLEDIVRCGLAAPSSKGGQPWRFHVVTARSVLEDVAGFMEHAEGIDTYVPSDLTTGKPRAELRSTVLESARVLREVPAAIFVEDTGVFSGGRQAFVTATPEALRGSIVGYTFEAMGVGMAVENMWLAAIAHGVSGVFLGDVLIAEPEISQRLGIRRDLVGALALGYAEPRSGRVAEGGNEFNADRVRWISKP